MVIENIPHNVKCVSEHKEAPEQKYSKNKNIPDRKR